MRIRIEQEARLLCLAALLAAAPAVAQPGHGGHGGHGHGPDHGHARPGPHGGWQGDIRHFHENDAGRWREGHWYHGRHGRRLGWWWVIGPAWYFYPAPVYPYPDPFIPPTAVLPLPPGVPRPAWS